MSFSTADNHSHNHHRLTNRLHTVLLLGGMIGLLAACGWIIAGPEGGLWALVLGGISLAFAPRMFDLPRDGRGRLGRSPGRVADGGRRRLAARVGPRHPDPAIPDVQFPGRPCG